MDAAIQISETGDQEADSSSHFYKRLDQLVFSLQERLESMPAKTATDFKMFEPNDQLREVQKQAYYPKVVAIGPTHRGKQLARMDRCKMRYVSQLLERRGKVSIEIYVKKLETLEESAREHYLMSSNMPQQEFLEMLLLDGLFIIELVRKYRFKEWRDPNDYIFKFDQVLGQVRHDLLLIENQLPLVVVNTLFEMTKTDNPDDNLQYLFLLFVNKMIPWQQRYRPHVDPHSCNHLLGLVYRSYFPLESCKTSRELSNMHHRPHSDCLKLFIEEDDEDGFELDTINSISELKEVGIRLKKDKGIELKDIRFVSGVMELPQLNISDTTESILRNLMMHEQSFPSEHTRYVTDYTFLMQCLVNSTKDVVIMRRSGIIINCLGDDETVCCMLNNLGKNTVKSSDFCYSIIFKRVNDHVRLPFNRWLFVWKTKPLARLSYLVYILVILTAAQTVLSLLSYRRRSFN